jgi:hypothetical protein
MLEVEVEVEILAYPPEHRVLVERVVVVLAEIKALPHKAVLQTLVAVAVAVVAVQVDLVEKGLLSLKPQGRLQQLQAHQQ